MDRPMAAGRLGGAPLYGQPPPPEPPLAMLLQRVQHGDPPPPSQDTQSTYFSQAPPSQVSPHPMSRWLTDPPSGAAARASGTAEPSQDSAVSGLSQESAPGPAGGALRTKSAALEQRIDHERQQRRQLERDVREAVTVVAAHVQALPELWHALLPRLLAGVERAVQAEAERAHRQAGERVRRVEERLDGLNAALRRAVQDGCRQSGQEVLLALNGLREAVSAANHRAGDTAEGIHQLRSQLDDVERSVAAPAAADPADREAALQLSSAAAQVSAAVSEVRRLADRLTEQLSSHQRQLDQQASRPPALAAPCVPPLAARANCLTSPVGTVRPQPCATPAAQAQRRQNCAAGGASPPSKQPRAGDLPPPPPVGATPRQTARAAPVPPKQAAVAALPRYPARTVRSTPNHGRRRPGSAGRRQRDPPPPPPPPLPPPPPPPPVAAQRPERAAARRKTVYSPESEVTSLSQLTGRHRAAAEADSSLYNFTWETDEALPWPRQPAVRTYSRTPQRTPLAAALPTGFSPETIRRSVSRPCRVPSAGPPPERRERHWL